MHPETAESRMSQSPSDEGWIALAPVHLFPWAILAVGFLREVSYAFLSRSGGGGVALGWGGAILIWGLGAFAVAVALKEQAYEPTRRWTLGLVAGLLGLQVAESLAWRFIPDGLSLSMELHWILLTVRVLLAAGALIALLRVRDADSGGPFDAAVTTLAFAAGLDWIGLPLLAFAALGGHPLLAALLQALRQPSEVLRRNWFDGQDEGLRFSRLGLGALLGSLTFLALIIRLFMGLGLAYTSFRGPYLWWTVFDLVAVALASLVLAFHVLRQTRRLGLKQGRGLAIISLLLSSVPLILLLIAAVIVVLILSDVIPFRLF